MEFILDSMGKCNNFIGLEMESNLMLVDFFIDRLIEFAIINKNIFYFF